MNAARRLYEAFANVPILRFPTALDGPTPLKCLNCSSELSLHQPDVNSPERLLGVCEACNYWYLIDIVPDLTHGVMVMLPDVEVVRRLSHPNPAAGISIIDCTSGEGSPTPPGPTEPPKSTP